ncbi:Putative serine/threonine-protein kinase pknH [Minicystis rosea]|nr:Putative serine/threonine-protein kinase pknH [Minicystis rosea]
MTELRLTAGTVFAGDFKVIRPLRTGGQGSLYVVEQLSTSKQRALKLMLPELVQSSTSRKRFELEAKIAARIQSDHVVESIASGVDQQSGVPWLAMELLEGEDLASHIQKRRALPPGDVLEIFGQLCHALGEAHRQGIVHRDLKPENIFLAASRRRGMPFMIKVLDFGIARVLAEAKTQSGATVTGLGTPMWMAPEQTVPGGRVEPSTDVWPLGLLAFRLLTGYLFWKAPYDPAASVLMLMAEAFMHPMPAASERAADYKCKERIPPGFDAWFAKAVARNMDERFADATVAFTELEPILAAAAEAASAPASTASPSGAAATSITGPTRPHTGPIPITGAPVLQTGPGRATWEGAPELSPSAVISANDAEASAAPRSETPASTTPAPSDRGSAARIETSTPTAEHAPPVQQPSLPNVTPPAKPRSMMGVIAGACMVGVFVGGGLFVWSRGRAPVHAATSATSAAPLSSSVPAASSSAAPQASASAAAATDTSAPADTAVPADSAAAAGSAAGPMMPGGRSKKLCKPAGQKCLSNDDCCDRTCRAWTCRANAALRDPYGN